MDMLFKIKGWILKPIVFILLMIYACTIVQIVKLNEYLYKGLIWFACSDKEMYKDYTNMTTDFTKDRMKEASRIRRNGDMRMCIHFVIAIQELAAIMLFGSVMFK